MDCTRRDALITGALSSLAAALGFAPAVAQAEERASLPSQPLVYDKFYGEMTPAAAELLAAGKAAVARMPEEPATGTDLRTSADVLTKSILPEAGLVNPGIVAGDLDERIRSALEQQFSTTSWATQTHAPAVDHTAVLLQTQEMLKKICDVLGVPLGAEEAAARCARYSRSQPDQRYLQLMLAACSAGDRITRYELKCLAQVQQLAAPARQVDPQALLGARQTTGKIFGPSPIAGAYQDWFAYESLRERKHELHAAKIAAVETEIAAVQAEMQAQLQAQMQKHFGPGCDDEEMLRPGC